MWEFDKEVSSLVWLVLIHEGLAKRNDNVSVDEG
jgi:hypothetical protein